MNRIGASLYGNTDLPNALSLEDSYSARDMLRSWYASLPEQLTPLNIALPVHINLQ